MNKDARLDDSEWKMLVLSQEEKLRELQSEKGMKIQEVKKKKQSEIEEFGKSIESKYGNEVMKITDLYNEKIELHNGILGKLKMGEKDGTDEREAKE